MQYKINNKSYTVESITCSGVFINVNGTTITDVQKQTEMFKARGLETFGDGTGYTVFCGGDEVCFDTFDDAYIFATTKQKNTFRV